MPPLQLKRTPRGLWSVAKLIALAALIVFPASAARKAQMTDMRIVAFEASPFPYFGDIPEQPQPTPFLDADASGRQFHDAPRGGRLYLDQTYNDRDSLLVTPPGFDPRRPDAKIILLFHGNLAKLKRDLVDRQGIPRQLAASHLNAALVAPQLAVDALDSSAGRFWEPGFLELYIREAAEHLAEGKTFSAAELDRVPIVIIAYSGGYLPTAFSLTYDKTLPSRIRGVILMDALFDEEPRFQDWIERTRGVTFFVSAYSKASAPLNVQLQRQLEAERLSFSSSLPGQIRAGDIVFLSTPQAIHNDFLSQAWVRDPLADLLRRLH